MVEGEFKFLLEGNMYVEAHTEPGKVSGCVVILEGQHLRIRFQATRDEDLNIMVGDRVAPLGWAEELKGKRVWYYLRGIVGYLSRDLGIGERAVNMTREELAEARANAASNLSKLLEDHLKAIEDLFSEGQFDHRRGDYEEYLRQADERTRAAYERRARGTNPPHPPFG
jgi:hypothetical protein